MSINRNTYLDLKTQYDENYGKLESQHKVIGTIRVILLLITIYSGYRFLAYLELLPLIISIVGTFIFLWLMRKHETVLWAKKVNKRLSTINQQEANFIEKQEGPLDTGTAFIDPKHINSFDLDIYGQKSLYHHLNRTATWQGSRILADQLAHPDVSAIEPNQVAVKELANKLDWRQRFQAIATEINDSKEKSEGIIDWASAEENDLSQFQIVMAYILPALLIITTTAKFGFGLSIPNNVLFLIISGNLVALSSHIKRIKIFMDHYSQIDRSLKYYTRLVELIEQEEFQSDKLKRLQANFLGKTKTSVLFKQLSAHFLKMDSVVNLLSPFLNGTVQYHVHVLNSILKWKKQHHENVTTWLTSIGELEALSSLANFSANNPTYTFPQLIAKKEVNFKALGHPLINSKKRICNDIHFKENGFVLLTGSNMSGKSTFLRSIGLNMVLARVGAPVCAHAAEVYPFPVLVSMRQTDSLTDGESYFFAEVKRLQMIVNKLQDQPALILLDEILRGTNSDDKRSGTVGYIKKLLSHNAMGIIATHDLSVCEITADYPEKLTNKHFEVEITDDELHFDYKLRDGICKNKSATFIMKKMNIVNEV